MCPTERQIMKLTGKNIVTIVVISALTSVALGKLSAHRGA